MGIELGTAALLSAVIGAGSAIHSGAQARSAAEDAEEEQRRLTEEAQEEADRLAAEARPEEETATIEFGKEEEEELGSTTDFLVSKTASTGLTSSTLTGGLGFS